MDDLAQADRALLEAEKLVNGVKALDRLWIDKWRAIFKAVTNKDVSYFEPVKFEALRRGHWETLRDLDFHSLKIKFERNTFLRLYFGSGSHFFRKRIEDEFQKVDIPDGIDISANWAVSETHSGLNLVYDLSEELSPGSVPHSLLILLISDWYRRIRTGQIHACVFKGEHFNPGSSPNRVYQIVNRLRAALISQVPGLEIEQTNSLYRIMLENSRTTIHIPREMPEPDVDIIRLKLLSTGTGSLEFQSKDVQACLKMSRSAANSLIRQWVESGLVRKQEQPKNPKFQIVVKI
jgi:hypothetical protein